MWAVILSQAEIRKSPIGLRPHLLDELDYETLYDKVLKIGSSFNEGDQFAFTTAVRKAYGRMHREMPA